MQVSDQLILKLEMLAQLELDSTERALLQKDLQNIIGMVNKLQSIDTTGLEPLVHLGATESSLRDDIPGGQLDRKAALSNATQKDEYFFLVPKVIEK